MTQIRPSAGAVAPSARSRKTLPQGAKSWEVALPGISEVLGFARDPLEYGLTRLAELGRTGQPVELARNGDLGQESVEVAGGGMADWKQGVGSAWIRVRWQTAEGRWTAEGQDKLMMPEPGDAEWRPLLGVVQVPQGVGKLIVLLSASGQVSEADAIWFDTST